MPAEDDGVRPHVARHVGGQVAEQGGHGGRAREQRPRDVVLGELPRGLAAEPADVGGDPAPGLASFACFVELEVVQRDAPLEADREHDVEQRLGEVERLPRLVGVQAQHRVAEIPVLADDVGVGVVLVVVGLLPALGGRDVVPLPRRGVDLGVAHPVPLAVHHVVPELHVLQDLGDRERGRAREPGGREQRDQQRGASCAFEAALDLHDLADVGGVALAEVGHELVADGVEFAADVVEVFGSQVFEESVHGEESWG